MRLSIEAEPVIYGTENCGVDGFDFLGDSLKLISTDADYNVLSDCLIGEYCKTKRVWYPSFQFGNYLLQFRSRIKNLIYTRGGRYDSRGYPNVCRWRATDIFQLESKSEIDAINIVENWAADRNISPYPWPIRGDQSFFSNVGGPISFGNRSLHVLSLTGCDFVHFLNGVLQPASLQTEDNQLEKADKTNDAGKANHPPVGRRFVLALLLLAAGFFVSVWGWQRFDHQRRLLGAALVGCGWLIGAGGLALWWLIGLPATWGWPI